MIDRSESQEAELRRAYGRLADNPRALTSIANHAFNYPELYHDRASDGRIQQEFTEMTVARVEGRELPLISFIPYTALFVYDDHHTRKQGVLEDYLGRYAKWKASDNQTEIDEAILDAIERTVKHLVPYGIPFWPGREIVDRVAARLASPPNPTLPTQAKR